MVLITDIYIAFFLWRGLRATRPHIRGRTDGMISRLITYNSERGIVLCIVQLICLAAYIYDLASNITGAAGSIYFIEGPSECQAISPTCLPPDLSVDCTALKFISTLGWRCKYMLFKETLPVDVIPAFSTHTHRLNVRRHMRERLANHHLFVEAIHMERRSRLEGDNGIAR
ncbi:hypothetical protein DAEQUDRAFT_303750 [Daedalea quercina L-15889]|uniref:Uncharacterized protein n=1 Tax=Daedalea quercina L-15889 TaxID=1314783 RepID=A0A165KEK3_9APHY|nr:hypothetical protein DAEQUDRAFT_303750 [Daedalea quercina L-15889]